MVVANARLTQYALAGTVHKVNRRRGVGGSPLGGGGRSCRYTGYVEYTRIFSTNFVTFDLQ